ncbi:MAG: ATP-dependent 6-phosphofructokinase [Gemmatimonadales bacterium]|nr:ATP-dependent 6-phosphofructokinase [Gemmatimonadales bacterium]NIN10372.1 ATP-dependent 6-phosphofructokinase [Gemmatimonadales bacterium]NIN49164.1 ATP-dependent 6-phosphofructokinase [Gemmatimonadales bacterium]NIP06628.1 ATP-dependent 6-phosphofructokinase [Gemmatimonadales bacterium]NIQ99958.1 ATP-dependent 6-phosphofructokinase [Gemmatimonadales bacterium]
MRVAISTGGGDAPGLNAVIRAIVLSAVRQGWEVFGVERGFGGLLGSARVVPMDRESVRGIVHLGGTILGTTNRGNPFRWPMLQTDGTWAEVDRSAEVLESFRQLALDALIAVGGDGTLHIAYEFWSRGLPIVGVPKTIDRDVSGTVMTFGFDTAIQTATDAIDKLHSTAESHERVMVVEVMGRHAGWIALNAGLAGGADVILIPEIPYDLEKVYRKIREREARGRHFSIVVVAEGARPKDGEVTVKAPAEVGGVERLGGVAERVAVRISEETGKETRTLTLGHLLRGGSPTTWDRMLGQRFGAAAVRAVAEGRFGHMVSLDPPDVVLVPLEAVTGKANPVPLDADALLTAREIGICMGD